jgi:sugar phosphate isomerase/epimerase
MFGITTAWKSPEISDGAQLLAELRKTEIPGLELEYRLSSATFAQLKKELYKSSLQVLSLHNYCPHPEILPIEQASGDAFWLSSIDERERKLAVHYSLRTIHNAHEIGAKAVVFHLGKTGIERENECWFNLYKQGQFRDDEGSEFFNLKLKQRRLARMPFLDAVLKSLDELNHEAEKLDIWLGVENRYFYDEIPDFEEIGIILDRFAGGRIGYWHDVGHAQTHETFGLVNHEKLLRTYADHLVGTHLHDCKEIGYRDHFAPGSGIVDFDMIKKYLSDRTIRIIEVHPKVSLEELQQGVMFLKEKGIIQ